MYCAYLPCWTRLRSSDCRLQLPVNKTRIVSLLENDSSAGVSIKESAICRIGSQFDIFKTHDPVHKAQLQIKHIQMYTHMHMLDIHNCNAIPILPLLGHCPSKLCWCVYVCVCTCECIAPSVVVFFLCWCWESARLRKPLSLSFCLPCHEFPCVRVCVCRHSGFWFLLAVLCASLWFEIGNYLNRD